MTKRESEYNGPGSNPAMWKRSKPKRLPPARLLRTEMREVHGQMVEVQVWSAGPSPRPAAPIGVDELFLAREGLAAEARSTYEPQYDLSRIGLPVQK